MKHEFQALFIVSNSERSWRVWVGSRIAAIIIGAGLVLALFASRPAVLPLEEQVIQSITTATLDKERLVLKPTPVVTTKPQPQPQPKARPQPAKSKPIQNASPQGVTMITPKSTTPRPKSPFKTPLQASPPAAPSQGSSPAYTPPRIATAPSSQAVTGAAAGRAPSDGLLSGATVPPQMGPATIGIVRARECARLDMRDRPADCPPNDELLALLAKERGPQYRPENAEGFSRNEQRWRGVPPPCLADGVNFRAAGTGACVRFGNVPSRVRTIREICEAKGLGGCAPTPGQAAVNAALEQVRRQEAAKAAKAP